MALYGEVDVPQYLTVEGVYLRAKDFISFISCRRGGGGGRGGRGSVFSDLTVCLSDPHCCFRRPSRSYGYRRPWKRAVGHGDRAGASNLNTEAGKTHSSAACFLPARLFPSG